MDTTMSHVLCTEHVKGPLSIVQRRMDAGKDHLANPRQPDSKPLAAPPATQRVIQLTSTATSPIPRVSPSPEPCLPALSDHLATWLPNSANTLIGN